MQKLKRNVILGSKNRIKGKENLKKEVKRKLYTEYKAYISRLSEELTF